ncbi:Protein of unknown function [Lentzea albidocapillata subsp. violacea]|uniref:DUF1214 domain-containing protein n=1 Tax=Lentzea albidocapillata subsp. violacea TaxID=128104 RepID=A0A1G9QUN9_9PSEU|nr:DUF1214 domain-containing protein [Lentzea albidocapillata]SDM13965.1 Protein of unknown function [Lentzea albidocapillata subsp. violacea]
MPDQAWSQFCRALEKAGEVILADQAPDTPLDRAEGYRYLSRLTREMLYSCLDNADPDFPRFHELDLVKIGADNPDNVYLSANIRGDRTYRITGTRGTIAYFSIGSKANRYARDGTMASTGELSDADLTIAPDGTVEIIASAEPRAGNWLPLAPDSTGLVVRQTYLDRTTETPGQWHVEQIGGPAAPAPLTPEFLAKALQRAALSVHGTAATFAHWTRTFMARPNELPDFGQEMFQRAGGDPEIFYLHGYWTLKPGEAWVIETDVPDCPYWNFQLGNWWMESLDHHRRITVNKHTASLSGDRLTIVVAAEDPGAGNWIDTCGHSSGTALLRWLGAAVHPIPKCRVVPLEEVR